MPFFFSVTYAAAKHIALMSQNGKDGKARELAFRTEVSKTTFFVSSFAPVARN